MNYVDGNLVRGNYKAHNWQAQPSARDQAESKVRTVASNVGYAVGLANTLREAWPTIRPVAQGLGMIA